MHTFLHGRFQDHYLTLPAGAAQLVIADLNYNITASEWDKEQDLSEFWAAVDHVLSQEGAVAAFSSGVFTFRLYNSRPEWYRYDRPWIKNKGSGHLNAKRRPLMNHEWVTIYAPSQEYYVPQLKHSSAKSNSVPSSAHALIYGKQKTVSYSGGKTERHPRTTLIYNVVDNDNPERIHSNQKPVPLLAELIEAHTRPGDLVVDLTAGSASAGIAAIMKGRRFWGCEELEKYYKPASKNLDNVAAAYEKTIPAKVDSGVIDFGLFARS